MNCHPQVGSSREAPSAAPAAITGGGDLQIAVACSRALRRSSRGEDFSVPSMAFSLEPRL